MGDKSTIPDSFACLDEFSASKSIFIGKHTEALTSEEQNNLIREAQKGNIISRNKFIEYFLSSNINWLVSIAKVYCNDGLPLEDLVQESFFGINSAIETFDINRNIKFNTYAHLLIKKSLRAAVAAKAKNFRYSGEYYYNIKRKKELYCTLCEKHGRNLTVAEFATLAKISNASARMILCFDLNCVSLNQPTNEEESSFLEDFIEDDTSEYSLIDFENNELHDEIIAQYEDLTPCQKEVFVYRFIKRLTLKECAEKLSTSFQNIKIIEDRILKQFRNNKKLVRMNPFR